MDPDMNKYETEHAVTAHPKMSKEEWEAIYRAAWDAYYTPKHLETILRRAGATGASLGPLPGTLLHFSMFTKWENVHPLQGGIFRFKYRRDRRPGLAREPGWTFYPKQLWDIARKLNAAARTALYLYGVQKRVKNDSLRRSYIDAALTPVSDDDLMTLQLFNQNDAARHAVQHERKVHDLTHAGASSAVHMAEGTS
jgi:hypothetical protein